MVWPRLRARAEAADELITRMEVQHHQITDGLDRIALLVPAWAAAPNTVTDDELAVAADQLSEALDAHLDEEEQAVLPLVAVHLTDKE